MIRLKSVILCGVLITLLQSSLADVNRRHPRDINTLVRDLQEEDTIADSSSSSEEDDSDEQFNAANPLDPHSVIDVPGKCPEGQKPDANGNCREEVRLNSRHIFNQIPVRCSPGQQPDKNGVCRDDVYFWNLIHFPSNAIDAARRRASRDHEPSMDADLTDLIFPAHFRRPASVIDVPVKCPDGEKPDANGVCREEVRRAVPKSIINVPGKCLGAEKTDESGNCREAIRSVDPHNVIDVPGKCPEGEKPDANGVCREEIRNVRPHNVIDVPGKCPDGQKPDANGTCRDVEFFLYGLLPPPSRVIDVPEKCPVGYKLNRNGMCRRVFDEITNKLLNNDD